MNQVVAIGQYDLSKLKHFIGETQLMDDQEYGMPTDGMPSMHIPEGHIIVRKIRSIQELMTKKHTIVVVRVKDAKKPEIYQIFYARLAYDEYNDKEPYLILSTNKKDDFPVKLSKFRSITIATGYMIKDRPRRINLNIHLRNLAL